MQVAVPSVSLRSAVVARLSVGQLSVGPIRVGRLEVRGASIGIRAGRARLDDVRTTVSVVARLWWDPPFARPRTTRLGDADLSFDVGDVDVPELRNIDVAIPSLAAPGVAVGVAPVPGVSLTQVVADDVRAHDTRLPVAPFQLTGLGLGSVDVEDVAVPAARVGGASVARVRGDPIAISAMALDGLVLPEASAADVTTGRLDIPLRRSEPFAIPDGDPLDLGIISVQLLIDVGVRTRARRMVLTGVRAGAGADAVELRDVTLPYDATDLTLSDLGLDTIEIPAVTVA